MIALYNPKTDGKLVMRIIKAREIKAGDKTYYSFKNDEITINNSKTNEISGLQRAPAVSNINQSPEYQK